MSEISELIGKTLSKVEQKGNDELRFYATDGSAYTMLHHQDCCESVYIEDVCGDFSDLEGSPILLAEEASSENEPPLDPSDAEYGSYTWTFYKLATNKGSVTIRWYGSSNGYYSESVDFEQTKGASGANPS